MKIRSRDLIPKRYKIITWLNIITQASFPLAGAFTPIMANSSTNYNWKLLPNNSQINYRQTQAYILKEGEDITTIAKKYNINIDSLRKLNQFRTFAHPFEQLKAGDELDIPMAPLPTIQWDNKKLPQSRPVPAPEEIKFAQLASQTGKFLSNKPSVDAAEKLARSMITSTASNSIEQWLNRTGNAQIRLEADKHFSLNSSQIDLLHPIYETKERLVFTQGSLHHTDQRLQTNLGVGIRWFGERQMFGGNTFFDYDISRGHTRLGLGAEYRRDYLKVSANSYHPLTHWKNSKDLVDHTERPAHGWDVRAESWLPSYPHLGGKLTYEQYYGDQVALFNSNKLQRNPQAMTAGVNYTPFPLLTLSAEHRQGKSSQQDARFSLNINYYLGKSWKQHIDPEAVNKLRSLIGNRYDFVNRNNNIVLQYQKSDVIHLSFTDVITGFAGEKKPLPFNVNSKYGFDHINWSASKMLAAGGQIIDEKNGKYSIILPEYKFADKASNQYSIHAVAVDKKNNSSPSATLQVVVAQPAIYASATTFTPTSFTLAANGKAQQILTLLVKDKQGNPIDISANEIRLEKTPLIKRSKRSVARAEASGLKASRKKMAEVSSFTRVASGKYTATLTASHQPEAFSLTPIIREMRLSPMQITIVADKSTPQLTSPTLNITHPQVANGKQPVEIQIQVVDASGNPLANTEVKWHSDKGSNKVSFKENVTVTDQNGFATAVVESTVAGDIQVTATTDGAQSQNITLSFIPDATTSTVTSNNIHVTNTTTVANNTSNPIEIKVTDANGNPVPDVEVLFSTDKGQLTNTVITTDKNGIAKTEIRSTEAGHATVTITVDGKDTTQSIEFVSDKTTSTVEKNNIHVTNTTTVANGHTLNPIEIKVTDANGNPVPDVEVLFSTDKGQLTNTVITTDKNGIAKTEIRSTEAGHATVTITVDGKDTTQSIEFVSDKTTSTVEKSNIHVTNTTTVANNTSNPIEIKVTDANGNPVPDVEVLFSTDKGQLTNTVITTDKNGIAKTEIRSTEAGHATVTITVDGKDTTQSIEFVSDKTTPQLAKPNTTQSKQVADGKQPFEIITQVVDANGNPIANAEVKWSSNKNLNEVLFSQLTTLTNKDGYATTKVTSTIAENITVTATTDKAGSQDITIQFVPDNKTAAVKPTDFLISHTSSIADGTTPNAIEVVVTDAQGNKVPNIDVTFTTNLGSLVNSKVKTDTNGVAKTEITSAQAGDATITVTVGGSHFDKTISFVANHLTAKIDSMTPETKNHYLADGKTTVIYTAKVVDANQNPVVNADVDWSSDVPEAVFNQGTSKTDDKGIATVMVTSTKARPTVITATTNNHNLSASRITFVADSTQAQITAFNINKSTLIANQIDTAIVETLITDNYGNPLENIAVTLTSNRGGDDNLTALTPLFKTDAKGYVKAQVNTAKAGDMILSAEIANHSQAKSATLKAIADNTTASLSIVASQKTVQISANAKKIRLTATVKDAHNNPLANTPVTWLSSHNQLSTNTTQTNSQGQAQVELSGYTSGDTKVTAQLLNNVTEEATIQFIAAAARAQNSVLTITPQTIVANGQTQATATLTLKDQWDNPVTGKTVQWDSNNSAITISDVRELATNKGSYQAKISGTRAGTFELTAISDTITKKTNIGLIADNSTSTLDKINITSRASAQANGVEQITVQATVIDASGNPAANIPVGWKTEIGELDNLISNTDYRGIAQVTLTSSVAGRGKVSAILGTSTKETSGDITFLAGSVSSSASTTILSVPSMTAAIGKTEIIVSLKDDTGNRLWGLSDKITLGYSTDLGLNQKPLFTESQTTVGTYHAELSGIKAGRTDISIYVDGIKLDTSVPLTITPDSQTTKVRGDIVPANLTEMVGNNVTFTATFEDANGNLLGAGVPVFWMANDGTQLSTPQTMTDINGQSRITVLRNIVGNAEVTVNLTSQNSKTAPVVRFEQGTIDVSKTILELTPSTIVAGSSSRLNIVLKDQFGNILTKQGASIEVKSTNSDITIGQVTEVTLLPGNYQATVTSNKAGTGELSIKLNGAAVTHTKTLRTIGDKASWKITHVVPDNRTIKAGDSTGVTYKATVMDQYNNPLPDVNVSWHLQGKSEPFPHSSTTNAQGIAEIKLTSQNAGELIMNAVLSDKVEKKADAVQVVANDINPQLSTFTTNKTDIGPDGLEEVLFTIKLQDSFGNPVLKQVVQIESNASTKDFIISKVTEQQDGQYTAKATAALSAAGKGPVKLAAKVGNQTIAQPIEIKIDAITPVLSFDDNVKNLTYSSKTTTGQAIKGLPNGFTPRWSSDNTSIATVNDQGEIHLKKAGHTKIWARIDGNGVYKSAEVSYELNVAKAKPQLKLTSSKTVSAIWDDGSKPKIETTFDNHDALALPVEFISKNTNVAHVSHVDVKTGEISQVKPGLTKIVVNTKETEQFLADSQEITYELAKARFNIHFAHSEQETIDEKAYFNLQQAHTAVPTKTEAKWRSSDNSVVNIAPNGAINHLGKGKAQLTLAIKNNDYYEDSEGSYTSKVYAKPNLPPISIVYRNNGKEERGGTQWLPVYTDDSMTVVIPPIRYTEYDKPSNVEVILRSGNRVIKSEKLQYWDKQNTIIYQPDVDLYKKDLTVEMRAEGKASLNIVANKQHDVQVDYIDPSKIGTIQTDYQPRYIITSDNKDDRDNKCLSRASAWLYSERHFMIQPITKIDIGNRKLLIPLNIQHSIENVKNDVDSFSFNNQYQVQKTNRYKFNETARKYSIKSNCLEDHYGRGKLKTHLTFGDKSATNEKEFYWEGLNRYPHTPSI